MSVGILDTELYRLGWQRFAFDESVARWVTATLPAARASVTEPQNASWLRYGGTWFAGVNVLPNDATGAVSGGVPLAGRVIDFIAGNIVPGGPDWEHGQVSVCYPGYPQRSMEESEAMHNYRRNRNAAHIDGLLPEGPARRRHLREFHGFILGLPMTQVPEGASPLVVWEGSHERIRCALTGAFGDLPPGQWGDVDVTEIYHQARREIFEDCRCIELVAQPGEAYLVHRLALHGVAPWRDGVSVGRDGRMIVYFRPQLEQVQDWLVSP